MPPVDVFVEAEGLKRRRALLESLAKSGAQPNIQGTPTQGIAQLLAALGQSYFANKGLRDVDQRQQALQGQYQTGLGQELEQFISRNNGTPDKPLPDGMMGPPELGVPGDPKTAIFHAMASRYPEMQEIGKGMLPSLIKTPKATKFDEWKAREDGTMYRTNLETGEVEIRRGALPPNPNKPTVQVDTFPKAEEDILKKRAEALSPGGELYQKAASGQENLTSISEAVTALNAGASTGQFEPFFQGLRKLGERLGIENAATVPTDQLVATLARRTLAAAGGKLGGQVSNADLEFLKSVSGSEVTNAAALKRLMALSAAFSAKDIARHNAAAKQLAERGGAFGYIGENVLPLMWQGVDDPEFLTMFERAMAGRPTIDAPPPGPRPGQQTPRRTDTRPPIRFGG